MARDHACARGDPGDDRFVATRDEFAVWAKGRKTYRMEFFYREMRRKTGLLMEGDAPVGGQWNFDAENRKSLPAGYHPPKRLRFDPIPSPARFWRWWNGASPIISATLSHSAGR